MKTVLIALLLLCSSFKGKATIHEVLVWDGYMQFLPSSLEVELGDTIHWLPLDVPSMMHTITSTNIPEGAEVFDELWQAPADTFFQYIPIVAGLYEYVCTPHIPMGMVGSFTVLPPLAGAIKDSWENDMLVYPNPTSDKLYLRSFPKQYRFRLWNAQGTEVMSGKIDQSINVSNLSEGSYLIEIIGDRPRVFSFEKIE
jgi:plastocyanin